MMKRDNLNKHLLKRKTPLFPLKKLILFQMKVGIQLSQNILGIRCVTTLFTKSKKIFFKNSYYSEQINIFN